MSYDLHQKRFLHNPLLSHARGTGGYAQTHFESRDHWRLTSQFSHEDRAYVLIVNHAWNGETWDQFRFAEYEMGTPTLLTTQEEYDERVQAIADHEGEDAASEWVVTQTETRVATEYELELREALKRRWMAIRELVDVSVTL